MRRYVVPSVDPEDQDLADLFCSRAKTTSNPDHMMIDGQRWSLAREIAKRMGLVDASTRILRVNQTGPMDYHRCTIRIKGRGRAKRVSEFILDMCDSDLLPEARKRHRQGVDPTRWLARSVLARMQGTDYLPCARKLVWIDSNERNCRRENLRMMDARKKENPQISENSLASTE